MFEASPRASTDDDVPVLQEITDSDALGKYVGQVKWFGGHRSLPGHISYNYGFITVAFGDLKGRDIFVHHTGIKPLSSRYRVLMKGEYVQFDIIENADGQMQAVKVTGIGGGALMCDVLPAKKYATGP